MADAARFLLAYAIEGADGKLHTSPVQRARDAVGRQRPDHRHRGDEDAVPDRDRGRDAARPGRRARHPAAGRDPQDPRLPAHHAQRPERASASPATRPRRYNNIENLDLEPLFPYNLITDQTPAEFELAKATLRQPPQRQLQRLEPMTRSTPPACGNGAEVAARLRASTSASSSSPNGLAEPRLRRHADQHLRRARRRHRAGDQRGAGAGLRRHRCGSPPRSRRAGTPRAPSSCSTARRSTCRCRTA